MPEPQQRRIRAASATCTTAVVINAGFFFFFFVLLTFLGPLLQHIEVPRLGVESELQPLAYARATATQDPSHVCDLHHSSQQRQILNPLSKARDRTRNLMVPSRFVNHYTTMGTPAYLFLKAFHYMVHFLCFVLQCCDHSCCTTK